MMFMCTFRPWYQVFVYIWYALRRLPPSVQTLCNAQFFAWMGWFPFLFYRYNLPIPYLILAHDCCVVQHGYQRSILKHINPNDGMKEHVQDHLHY